jgi:hypothetical protein
VVSAVAAAPSWSGDKAESVNKEGTSGQTTFLFRTPLCTVSFDGDYLVVTCLISASNHMNVIGQSYEPKHIDSVGINIGPWKDMTRVVTFDSDHTFRPSLGRDRERRNNTVITPLRVSTRHINIRA